MQTIHCLITFFVLLFLGTSGALAAREGGQERAPEKLRALILDGQNNHDWRKTTIATRATLLACGRFAVDVATSPADKNDRAAWEAWLPEWDQYDVLVSNFNDGGACLWSDAMKAGLVAFLKGGGGLVVIHAADNSCGDWEEYNRMIAVGGWGGRTAAHGSHLRLVDGSWEAVAAPEEGSGSHGPQHEFVIEADEGTHPILRGLPPKWKHAKDELYDSLRGPAEDVTVLASTWCPKTQRREPMIMAIAYGQGRVLHTPMGHVGGFDPVHCVGFQTILARGTEWAASGAVSLGIPADFPTADRVSIIAPDLVRWPSIAGGDDHQGGAGQEGHDKEGHDEEGHGKDAPQGKPALSLLPRRDGGASRPESEQASRGKDMNPKALANFVFSDAAVWSAGSDAKRNWIEHTATSDYRPPVRSPLNIALLANARLGSFTLEADLQQTGKEYGHRDMCLFFGYQDPAHYYYAHIATKTDDHAHNIFIVDGEARRKISTHTTAGHDWSKHDWHRVRLVRDVVSGQIEIYMGDSDKAIMSARDTTFGRGYLGFGSFDDRGRISDVRVWSDDVQAVRIPASSVPANKAK